MEHIPAAICRGGSTLEMLRLISDHDGLTQPAAARKMKITLSSCNTHFKKLESCGLIERGAIEPSGDSAGRPSQRWHLSKAANLFLGITIEGEEINGCICNFAGESLFAARRLLSPGCDQAELLARFDDLCETLLRQARNTGGRVLQAYAGSTGAVTFDGWVKNDPNIPALNGLNLGEELQRRFGLAALSNDIGRVRIEYYSRNCLPDQSNMFVFWGTGVTVNLFGGAELLSWPGKSRRKRGLWDFGHYPVVPGGELCRCGRRGCLEAYIGGAALLREAVGSGCRTLHDLIGAAAVQPELLEIFGRAAERLGEALFPVLEMFGVDNVFLFGENAALFDRIVGRLRDGISRGRTPEDAAAISIQALEYRTETLALGAAMLAKRQFLNPQLIAADLRR